jgi:putative transposase
MSYIQIYYHIVFSTQNREPVLLNNHRKRIYGYLWGILEEKNSHLYRIGGTRDHLHLLTHIHPTVPLAELVRDLKTASTFWIKKEGIIPHFRGWQKEYAAFTKSHENRDAVIEYIKDQEEHHKKFTFIEELRQLLIQHGIEFDERYLK